MSYSVGGRLKSDGFEAGIKFQEILTAIADTRRIRTEKERHGATQEELEPYLNSLKELGKDAQTLYRGYSPVKEEFEDGRKAYRLMHDVAIELVRIKHTDVVDQMSESEKRALWQIIDAMVTEYEKLMNKYWPPPKLTKTIWLGWDEIGAKLLPDEMGSMDL